MGNYKLTYFNSRGRGEVIRYLFALADKEYEDVRVTFEEWGKMKAESPSPFGQLPILEVDGKVMCQSHAIAAYLAREFGYAGKNSTEEYQIYLVQGAVTDLMTKLVGVHFETDEQKKAELGKELQEKFIPAWLTSLEKIFQEGGTNYFAGDRLTVGDLYFFFAYEYLNKGTNDTLPGFSGLGGLFTRVCADPKIKAWRERRPKTEF